MCERGGKAAQLPSGPLAVRFTKISNTSSSHCRPFALSSLTLLRILLPGHSSLFFLLTFVGVQTVGSIEVPEQKISQDTGESCLSWKEKCSHGSALLDKGHETTWHNVRGTIVHRATVHTWTHTRSCSGEK